MNKQDYDRITSAIEFYCNDSRYTNDEKIIQQFALYGVRVYGKYNHDSEKSIHNYQTQVVTTYLDSGSITVWSKYSADETCDNMDYILNVYENRSLIAQFAIYACQID